MRWTVVVVVVVMCGCARDSGHAPSDLTCSPKRKVLHLRSVPPVQGEQLKYDETVVYDLKAMHGTSHFATTETAISVRDRHIDELEARFDVGTAQLPGTDGTLDVTGKVFRIRVENGKSIFRQDRQPVAAAIEPLLGAYDRHDVGQAYWALQFLVDRTFRVGVPTQVKLERGMGASPTEATVVLHALDATSATFAMDAHAAGEHGPPFKMKADVTVDLTRARLIAFDQHGEIDLDDATKQRAGLDGTITSKQRFVYAHAPPARSPAECSD